MYVLGLDIGTQGAKTAVVDGDGRIIAEASAPIVSSVEPETASCIVEQHPSDWWDAAAICLGKVIKDLKWAGTDPRAIKALAVDSTSGTIVPLDKSGIALRPAIMYNDGRSVEEAAECNSAGSELTDPLGYKFSASFALPKILWIMRNEPEIFQQTACFAHAADYIVSRLTGSFRMSDTSNALKTGYDLVNRRWPEFIERKLGIPLDRLPQVVTPGLTIGTISSHCSQETGLAAGTPVVAGVTDGTAGFLASGAVKVGEWNSTIGSTLVVRGVSNELIKDPQGRIYCHAHPQGHWLPGGASNAGAECLTELFRGRDLDDLNAQVPLYSPTNLLIYPLIRVGERLPFVHPKAKGFIFGEPRDSLDLYTGYLEGVGYVERWCLELMDEFGAQVGDTVYATGGGAKSLEWMQVRANIMDRRVVRPLHSECAMGAAALAASSTLFSDLETAVKAIVKPGDSVEPEPSKVGAYDERYQSFRNACHRRGYV